MSISLEVVGDQWSLLIVRDLMVRGYRTFKEFMHAGEGIASNILTDRLRRLKASEIIEVEAEASDRRRVNYRLTEKGIALAPVLMELLIWAAHHERTSAPNPFVESMESNREQFLAEVYRRWKEHDSTPLIPKFKTSARKRSAGKPRLEGM